MKILFFVIIAVSLAIPIGSAAETAQASKSDNLREKPFTDSKIVLAIKSGQAVDVQKREGSWYFVSVGKKTGWVPMLSVRRAKSAAVATKGGTVQTGRSSTGSVVNTTGVRGLNEETLKTASFGEEAVASVEKNRVSAAEATTFAAAGGIVTQSVPSLAIPSSVPNGGKK